MHLAMGAQWIVKQAAPMGHSSATCVHTSAAGCSPGKELPHITPPVALLNFDMNGAGSTMHHPQHSLTLKHNNNCNNTLVSTWIQACVNNKATTAPSLPQPNDHRHQQQFKFQPGDWEKCHQLSAKPTAMRAPASTPLVIALLLLQQESRP